jgi:hypothetical protein
MGFDLEKSFSIDDFALHSVFLSPLVDFFHPRDFFLVQGHDYLSAKFVIDFLFAAKVLHRQFAFPAIDCLERTGFVVNARMQDTGVMTSLVLGQNSFLLEDHDFSVWESRAYSIGRGQPDDSTPDDTNVGFQNGLA